MPLGRFSRTEGHILAPVRAGRRGYNPGPGDTSLAPGYPPPAPPGRKTGIDLSDTPLKPSEVAQITCGAVQKRLGPVTIEQAVRARTTMRLRLMTGLQRPITPAVGDILQAGLLVDQDYGEEITVQVYTRRLACLNGMTAVQKAFRCGRRQDGGYEAEVGWLRISVNEAIDAYEDLVLKAREMAGTPVDGDPEEALLSVPSRLVIHRGITTAFGQHIVRSPAVPEWDLLNAFTRVCDTRTAD